MGDEKENRPVKYVIHVKNHLDTHWERWFEGMTITHMDDGITILSGELADQSALYGLLEKIHNMNLSLVSFQKVESEMNATGDSNHEEV